MDRSPHLHSGILFNKKKSVRMKKTTLEIQPATVMTTQGTVSAREKFRLRLQNLSNTWKKNGLPSNQQLVSIARQLEGDKKKHGIQAIWSSCPLMVTTTIDDGLGQGLEIIHRYATVMGFEIHPLGLMQTPEKIVAECRARKPHFLGLTMLQLDSDDALAYIGHHLPRKTRLIAGGPVFKFDTEMAQRCGVHFVAPDVAHFVDFMCRQLEKNRTTWGSRKNKFRI